MAIAGIVVRQGRNIDCSVTVTTMCYLFPVIAISVSILSVLPAEAALIRQTFKGNLNLVDPNQSLWQTPDDAEFDEWGYSYKTPFELNYTFDTASAPVYEDVFGSKANYYFSHGDLAGEGLTFAVAGQEFNIANFGRSFGNNWGGPSPEDNWYGLGFNLNGFNFSFLFASASPLNNDNLPEISDIWKNQISSEDPDFSGGFNIASIETTQVPENIPTPALLPGLIGMGAMMLRRKRQAA